MYNSEFDDEMYRDAVELTLSTILSLSFGLLGQDLVDIASQAFQDCDQGNMRTMYPTIKESVKTQS